MNNARFLRMVAVMVCNWWLLMPAFAQNTTTNPPIYIAFLWHMHQPIYWPYENINTTQQQNRYPFNVIDIFNSRTGPYNSWPKDAVQKGITAGMGNFGAQVSFSGSLIENLNNLQAAGNGNFSNWKSPYQTAKNNQTVLGNPRLDMVGFGYFHPLMSLLEYDDIRDQIQRHKAIMAANFTGSYSKGIFPPENAFAPHMIPALVDEGLEWVLVDNIHFDRACAGYPFNTGGNVYEANKADQRNPNPNDWVQLNGLWAPTQNSAAWGRKPHYVSYTDPATGQVKKIIAVPADRYMGNEDGRGGYGALNYDNVMSQLTSYNTDPNHPILIVLHHDGDNYGGGTDSYYGSNFQNFVNWLQTKPNQFKCTTIQDYLEMFPPDTTDVIHIENGSWSGADNGDPEFKKWNADYTNCVSPDRNSWAVITAAKNYVKTVGQMEPLYTPLDQARKLLGCAQASDYWYWDGSLNGIWDTHPTNACNQAISLISSIIPTKPDQTAPSIWVPQREPYNPGANEWNQLKSSDFTVFTYAFDVNGLQSVTLKYRTDSDGTPGPDNDTYAGGSGVSAWVSLPMTAAFIAPQTTTQPLKKATEYAAQITGLSNQLVDYYVEAVDSLGNVEKTILQHVWVGANNALAHVWANCDTSVAGGGGGGGGTLPNGVSWVPQSPTANDTITVYVGNAGKGGKLHWGVNGWLQANNAYWPANSYLFNNSGPAIQSPMALTGSDLSLKLGPFNKPAQTVTKVDFVINFDDNSWDNNNGQDYHITVSAAPNGLAPAAGSSSVRVSPNPFREAFAMQVYQPTAGAIQLTVSDIQGRVLHVSELGYLPAGEHALALPAQGWAAGLYLLTVETRAGRVVVKGVKE